MRSCRRSSSEHAVISTKLLAGQTIAHVYAEESPGAGFEPVEPDLKDVYFAVMGGHRGARAARMRFGEVFRYEFAYRLRSISTWLYAGVLFLIGVLDHSCRRHRHEPDPRQRAARPRGEDGALLRIVRHPGHGRPLLRCGHPRPRGRNGCAPLHHPPPPRRIPRRPLPGSAGDQQHPRLRDPDRARRRHEDAVSPARCVRPESRSRRICSRCCSSSLPNLVLVGAILFTIAALTRQVIPVYLGAIAIFIGYLVAANYWSGITNPMLSALADPLGINALKGMTEYWTASERNTRLIGFPSMLLWNRLLWLAIAAALFAVLQRTFRFTQRDVNAVAAASRWTRLAKRARAERASGAVPQLRGVFGSRTRMRQTLAVTRHSLAEAMSGRAFPVAFLAAIGLVLLWGWNVGAIYLRHDHVAGHASRRGRRPVGARHRHSLAGHRALRG